MSTKVIKSWDHTWEKPTEYQLEQVRIAIRAAHDAKPEEDNLAFDGRGLSPTLRIWEAMRLERERWKIN